MAAAVSLLELRTRARQLSDTEGNPNVTDAELTALANRHASDLWDRLVDAGPADYAASTTQITTDVDVIPYPLPEDFRNLVEVYVREGTTGQVRRLRPMPEGTRARYRAPQDEYTVDIEYIPTCTVLESDGDTLDGVSGWDELIVNLMARDVQIKRDGPTADVLNNIARLDARVTQRARKRDRGPKFIVDADDAYAENPDYITTARLACYRLRAGNLELYEHLSYAP